MSLLQYFAYGSNMLTARLRRRVPSTTPLGKAVLDGWRLCFHKRGADGSAKCNIVRRPGSCVHGVVFSIARSERHLLDRAEGLGNGYELADLQLTRAGEPIEAFAYVTADTHIDDTLEPFGWYKDFVVQGADEHQLPKGYVDTLAAIEAVPDVDKERLRKNREVMAAVDI